MANFQDTSSDEEDLSSEEEDAHIFSRDIRHGKNYLAALLALNTICKVNNFFIVIQGQILTRYLS